MWTPCPSAPAPRSEPCPRRGPRQPCALRPPGRQPPARTSSAASCPQAPHRQFSPRASSLESLLLVPAEHYVQVLERLARRALHQVVQAGHHNEALSIRGQLKPHVAIIRAHRVLNLRQLAMPKNPNPMGTAVKPAQHDIDFVR